MPSLDGIPFIAGEPGPNAPPHMWFEHYQNRIAALEAKLRMVEKERNAQREEKKGAYTERNMLVALLARIYPSGIRPTDIPDWDPEWQNCCYIDLPSGQISYHYHSSEAALFKHLPAYTKPWDGHTKEQVHERIRQLFGAVAFPATGVHNTRDLMEMMAAILRLPSLSATAQTDIEILMRRHSLARSRGCHPRDI